MIYKTARQVVVAVIGGTVLLVGLLMLVTPGPGLLGILGGLAILGSEFAWAAWLFRRLKKKVQSMMPSRHPVVPKGTVERGTTGPTI